MIIDFAIIGFPKCGTTSLVKNLSKLEDVQVIDKEPPTPEFFNDFYDIQPNKKFGFKNPMVIYDLHHWYPIIRNSKVIICVREPRQFLWSFYSYRKEEFKHDNVSYEEIVHDPTRKWRDVCLSTADFDVYINNIYAHFSYDKVLIVSLELLESSPHYYYEIICKFLGIRFNEKILLSIENINYGKLPYPRLYIPSLDIKFKKIYEKCKLLEKKSQSFIFLDK